MAISKEAQQILSYVKALGVKVYQTNLENGCLGEYDRSTKTMLLAKGCDEEVLIHEAIHVLWDYSLKYGYRKQLKNLSVKRRLAVYLAYRKEQWYEEMVAYTYESNPQWVINHFKKMLNR
jgi:hypothetical protein